MERMGRVISTAIVEHLDFFQSFDDVKVYFDNSRNRILFYVVSRTRSAHTRAAGTELAEKMRVDNLPF